MSNDRLNSSFFNLISGAGTNNDQIAHTKFCARDRMEIPVLEGIMRVDPIMRNIIEAAPADAIRAWREFTGGDPEDQEAWGNLEIDLDYKSAIEDLLVYSEVYGGAVIVPSFDESVVARGDYANEFDLDSIPEGGNNLRGWLVYASSEVKEHNTFGSAFRPADPRSHHPEVWEIVQNNYGSMDARSFRSFMPTKKVLLHASWTMPVIGAKPMRHNRPRHGSGYFGESRIDVMFDYAMRSNMSQSSGATALLKSTIDVFYADFGERIRECEGDPVKLQQVLDDVNGRLRTIMSTSSANHPLALDKSTEGMERLGTNNSAAGVDKLIKQYVELLAAARPMPLTRALGQQTSGMSSDDEGGLSHWYDLVDAYRQKRLQKTLAFMDSVVARDRGVATLPWKFGDLHPATEKEIAELEKIRAERDKHYTDIGLPLVRGHIMQNLAASGTYDFSQDEIDNMMLDIQALPDDNGS